MVRMLWVVWATQPCGPVRKGWWPSAIAFWDKSRGWERRQCEKFLRRTRLGIGGKELRDFLGPVGSWMGVLRILSSRYTHFLEGMYFYHWHGRVCEKSLLYPGVPALRRALLLHSSVITDCTCLACMIVSTTTRRLLFCRLDNQKPTFLKLSLKQSEPADPIHRLESRYPTPY